MDRFYFIVLTVATISLILFLTYIGILMKYYSKSDLAYPSIANTCPDYWTLDTDATTGETKCKVPDDGKPNRGTASYDCQSYINRYPDLKNAVETAHGSSDCSVPEVASWADRHWNSNGKNEGRSPTVSGTNEVTEVIPYGEDSIICDLKNWANTNSIVWDGVSNYNKCGL